MRAIQNSFQQWRSTEGNSTEKERKKIKKYWFTSTAQFSCKTLLHSSVKWPQSISTKERRDVCRQTRTCMTCELEDLSNLCAPHVHWFISKVAMWEKKIHFVKLKFNTAWSYALAADGRWWWRGGGTKAKLLTGKVMIAKCSYTERQQQCNKATCL